MTKIENHINGYLQIDDNQFVFNFSDQIVTLLPAESDPQKQKDIIRQVLNRKFDESEYLIGTYRGFQFAFLKTKEFHYDRFSSDPSIRFSPPIVVKTGGNAYGYYKGLVLPWRKFHAISFFGGNINGIFDPSVSVDRVSIDDNDPQDRLYDLRSKRWEEYSHDIEVTINGEKATFSVSVYVTFDKHDPDKMGTYTLGERNSYIRLTFENEQDINIIPHCYDVISNLTAILTKQNNVTFYVRLYQRIENGQLLPHAVCKVYDPYKDYSNKKFNRVISILQVWDYIPQLINVIENKNIQRLLTLLPDNNFDADRVYITNIQDLCASLEKAYEWRHKKEKKDKLIEELIKCINEAIGEFVNEHPGEIDIYKQTTILNAFEYLNFTLKEKIFTLYNEHKEIVDSVTKKWKLPSLTMEAITAFVKLRNKKAHEGIFEWGNESYTYLPLFALYYTCFFDHIGISEKDIKPMILRIF